MTMRPATLRPLGRTDLSVTAICVGTSPLASMPGLYGYGVDHARAEATIAAVLDGPLNFIDTSNNYGGGNAEKRIGAVLRARGGLPHGVVLATKADADPVTGDFSAIRVRQSVHESLERLGLARVQLMYLHDPEYHVTFEQAMADGGPVQGLVGLRDEGVIEHIGVAAGPVDLMRRFVATGVFDVALSHNRYTLLDRSAEPLIADALAAGVGYVNAAPYGGGILAKGPDAQPRYAYRETPERVRDAVRGMHRACADAGVPLRAAALQFSLRDPRVAATVVGMSEPERIAETLELARLPIADETWAELDSLSTRAGVVLD